MKKLLLILAISVLALSCTRKDKGSPSDCSQSIYQAYMLGYNEALMNCYYEIYRDNLIISDVYSFDKRVQKTAILNQEDFRYRVGAKPLK